jgi:hypothetical protein
MELTNRTLLPATLARTALDDDALMGAAVSLRATYDYRDGALTLAEAQAWDISSAALDTPYGPLDGADPFGRAGVDVFLLGLAHAPGGEPVPSLDLGVAVGAWRRDIKVFGDRAWVRVGDDFVASRPLPFAVMPLHVGRAYGGKGTWDGLEVPFGDNPEGRGFCVDATQVEGALLPNLEEPGHEVRTWRDQPAPVGVGFCSMQSGARIRNGAEFDPETYALRHYTPRLFQSAWPAMIAPPTPPGAVVTAWGIDEDGPWRFALPDAPAVLTVAFDDEVVTPPLELAQVGIETEYHRVFVTWRHAFKYVIHPRQRRAVILGPRVEGRAA